MGKILTVLITLFISQTFWTAVAAIGSVTALYFIYRQISYATNSTAYDFLRKEDDRFSSEGMRRDRCILAKTLLLAPDKYKEIDKYADYVLGYFEDLGLMIEKKLVPTYFVWVTNCYYVLNYWHAAKEYIYWVRKTNNDPNYYSGFEYLFKMLSKIEKKMSKKKHLSITNEDIRRFLREELCAEIRPLMFSDLDRIVQIEECSFSEEQAYSRSQLEALYREHSESFFVAEVLGKVVGYIIGYNNNGIGEIDSLAVAQDFRKLGIGKMLSEHLIEWLKERDVQTISLEVRTTSDSVINLYKELGFKITQTITDYYGKGIDAYLMRISSSQEG